MAAEPVPEQYNTVTPYLVVKGGAKAIAFYEAAFGAELVAKLEGPNGMIAHAELKIGNTIVKLADEHPDFNIFGPETLGGTAVGLVLHVEDVDTVFQRALDAGATESRPVENQFYGDRSGTLHDPFGHRWTINTHVEDVSMEEMQRRMDAMM